MDNDVIVEVRKDNYVYVAYKNERYVEVYHKDDYPQGCLLQSLWFSSWQINDANSIRQYIHGYCFQFVGSWDYK